MKSLKFLLTIIFCFSLQASFSQWLTNGNIDVSSDSYIGTRQGIDTDLVLKRNGVTGLKISSVFSANSGINPGMMIYSHTPSLQVGGKIGDIGRFGRGVQAYIIGTTYTDHLTVVNGINATSANIRTIQTTGLDLYTSSGEALININLNNATRTWTGVTYKRQGAEKWFSGIIHETDDFTIRRNQAHNDFIINSEGRVKIGNSRPVNANSPYVNTYKLAVDGTVISTQTVVTQQFWADDEFKKESPLLKEEKEFAMKNNHLLGIPSQDEIIEKGLDLGEMQAMQIRKIEQLYKHMWEQQEMIEKLTKEIELLKRKKD